MRGLGCRVLGTELTWHVQRSRVYHQHHRKLDAVAQTCDLSTSGLGGGGKTRLRSSRSSSGTEGGGGLPGLPESLSHNKQRK